jgi:hypothetical protein
MRLSIFVMVILAIGEIACGQTTRGSGDDSGIPPAWEKLVSSIAAAAAGHDPQSMQAIVPGTCSVHRFNADRDADLSSLLDFISANSVLGDHAYLYPPVGAGADIARDVDTAAMVPDSAKKTLAMGDAHNEPVVLQWLTQNLGPADGTPIGVIVLWNYGAEQDQNPRPMFILVKGEKDGNGFKLSQMVYGDPLDNEPGNLRSPAK